MKRFKKIKPVVFIAIALVVIVAVIFAWKGKAAQVSAQTSERRTAAVEKGNLSVTLTGSGAVKASQRKEIQSQVAGFVSESYLVEGKAVKAGDVILKLESNEAEYNLKKMENALKQKELTANQQSEQLKKLWVNAPINGRISGFTLKEGDSVSKGQVICSIADEAYLQVRALFKNTLPDQLNGSENVKLHIQEYAASLDASVESVFQSGPDVEALLVIKNPGAIASGVEAIAEITASGGSFLSEPGILEWRSQEIIKAASAGTVKSVSVLDNQTVSKGKSLLFIENDELPTSVDSTLLDLEKARYDFEQAKLDMEKYTITAPFDGTLVSAAELSVGDSIKAGVTLAVLLDTGEMEVEINIDELDISKVKTGQEVLLTVEALEDTMENPLAGKVESIAVEGSSSGGVSSYPVTVVFSGQEDLKVGMNADATIRILNKENALLVPIEAVQKQGDGYYVWVMGDDALVSSGESGSDAENPLGNRSRMQDISPGQIERFQNMSEEERTAMREQNRREGGFTQDGSSNRNSSNTSGGQNGAARTYTATQNSYYAGASRVRVELGEHNENFMEIIKGLNEGDIVILPQITAAASSAAGSRQNFIMPAGIGGGNTGFRRGVN